MKPQLKSTKQRRSILHLIFRFRFATTKHLQLALGLKYLESVQARLNLLTEHGLIGRNYTGRHKLAGLPAAYFLQPPGIAAIKEMDPAVDEQALHNAYYAKSAKEPFIRHCIAVGDVYAHLTHAYSDNLEFFTRSESKEYDYFPQPLPDAYFTIRDSTRADYDPVHYFLEVWEESTPAFVFKKRLGDYAAYTEDVAWEDATGTNLPCVLVVAENPDHQKKLQKIAQRHLENTYVEDLRVTVTTIESLPRLDLLRT